MKMFIFDVDGTIVPKGTSDILDSTIEAFKIIKEHGDISVIATGRSLYMLHDVLFDLVDYFVSSNGQVISKGKDIFYEKFLSEKQVNKLEEVYHKYNTTYNYKRRDGYHIFGDYELAYNIEATANRDFVANLLRGSKKDEVYNSFIYEEDPKLVEKIREEISSVNLGLYRSILFTYDVLDKDISKEYGIRELEKRFDNIETYGFGDGENDLAFLKIVDHHYVMGDGNENLKKQLTNIIGSSHEASILNEIKKIYNM